MFTKTIAKLRAKSDDQKKMIALISSAIITGLIFAVWLFSVVEGGYLKEDQTASVESAISPFESSKKILKEIFQGKTEIIDIN